MAETTCDLYVKSDISMPSPAFSSYDLSDKNQKSESDCEDCTTLKVISMASWVCSESLPRFTAKNIATSFESTVDTVNELVMNFKNRAVFKFVQGAEVVHLSHPTRKQLAEVDNEAL